jgi:hypothetical protein
MLVDRYPAEDIFARVPELASHTDPVLVQLDQLLRYRLERQVLGTGRVLLGTFDYWWSKVPRLC